MKFYRSFDFPRGPTDPHVWERGIAARRGPRPEPEGPDAISTWVVKVHGSASGRPAGVTRPATEPDNTGPRIATILHPTDFSRHSAYAFRVACFLAQENGARVIALHVASAPLADWVCDGRATAVPLPDEDCARLWSALCGLRAPSPMVRVERRLERGDVATAILRVARETGSDLIVMGCRGRGGQAAARMGRVAASVVRKAPCSVATITAAAAAAGHQTLTPSDVDDYWTDLGAGD